MCSSAGIRVYVAQPGAADAVSLATKGDAPLDVPSTGATADQCDLAREIAYAAERASSARVSLLIVHEPRVGRSLPIPGNDPARHDRISGWRE